MIYKQSKYLFPNEEKAREMKESLESTIENPCSHTTHGLKDEMTKTIYEKMTLIDEATGEEIEVDNKEVIIKESEPTGKWQLDVAWCFKDEEEIEEARTYHVQFGAILLDLDHEGNEGISGRSYLKEKL